MLGFRLIPSIKIAGLLVCVLLLVSACTILGGASEKVTPTPVPTSSIAGLEVASPQVCQVAVHNMIRVEQSQGDLISWSPVDDTVAYIASTLGSSWNVGELSLLSAPVFDTPLQIASQAAGELTWSPNATSIAYLGLRRSDNLYTIELAYPDGRPAKDLFPGEAARTDSFSSQKAILDYMDEGRLSVLVSCGTDCLQAMDFGVLSGLSRLVGDHIQPSWDLWTAHTNHPAQIPAAYTDLKGQLNWSPDESQIAYIDDNGLLWIINVEAGNLSPVDFGFYGTATETDWSFDNRYLAVQVDQNLRIYSFDCP